MDGAGDAYSLNHTLDEATDEDVEPGLPEYPVKQTDVGELCQNVLATRRGPPAQAAE